MINSIFLPVRSEKHEKSPKGRETSFSLNPQSIILQPIKKPNFILIIKIHHEVHKYKSWSLEIKNIYDSYPDLKIIFTGSSIINISKQQGDLSRRAVVYELPGMSFREFLSIKYNLIAWWVEFQLTQCSIHH